MTFDRREIRSGHLPFGMVPPKTARLDAYKYAADIVLRSLGGDTDRDSILDAISEVKGLCNRINRMDQADWVLVWLWLGLPERRRLRWMAYDLVAFRTAYKECDDAQASFIAERLQRAGLMTALNYFLQRDEPPTADDMGFLYVINSRQNIELLNIGQTSSDLVKRVEEISASNPLVVEPFGIRHLWRVRDPGQVEKRVHALLAEYLVQADANFFSLTVSQAVRMIDDYLVLADAAVRRRGVVKRLLLERGYGFIGSDNIDFFFHAAEVADDQFEHLTVGDRVTFDRLDTSFGLAAAKVVRVQVNSSA